VRSSSTLLEPIAVSVTEVALWKTQQGSVLLGTSVTSVRHGNFGAITPGQRSHRGDYSEVAVARTFADLAEKLKMPVEDLMQQCNGYAAPSKALVRGLAKELDITESYLENLAEEVR
jgi:hypothetical protein